MPMNVKRGMVKSCGHLTKSYAEQEIYKHLKNLQIPFIYDRSISSDLVKPGGKKPLRFDFILFKQDGTKILIEHQGQQHFYEKKDPFYKEFGRVQKEITDKLKKDYCKKHGIPLYETFFNEDYISHVNSILLENGFLNAG